MAHTKRDGLYRRENRIFAFRYKGRDGIWREKYTGNTDRQEARVFKSKFLEQLDQGALPNDMAKWPLSSAIAYYLQSREALLAPRTWKVHRSRCNSLIRTIGNKRLEQVDNRVLEAFQSTRRKSGISAAAVNKEVEILSYILRKAKLWRRLEEDYKPLPIAHESPRRPIDVEGLVTLVKAGLSNPDWEAPLMAAIVAANTACRSWEIKSLRIGDIDMTSSNRKLLVRRENTKSDAGAREQTMTLEERLRFHQRQSGPVMEQLHAWLMARFAEKKVEPNSGLGMAMRYLQKRWERLTLFLRQPGAPLDNNICERALKKAILHRKNSLFYKTENGAHVGDLFMSLIHTCELCGANPFDYLTQLQRHDRELAQNPSEWMPWNYSASLEQSGASLDSG